MSRRDRNGNVTIGNNNNNNNNNTNNSNREPNNGYSATSTNNDRERYERARAIAEVSVMESNNTGVTGTMGSSNANDANTNNNDSQRGGGGGAVGRPAGSNSNVVGAADEALMEGDFGETDEAGVRVRSLFLEFLYSFWEPIEMDIEEDEEKTNENEPKQKQERRYYPYVEQADQMARVQLSISAEDEDDEDEDDEYNANGESSTNGFSTTMLVDFRHLNAYEPDLAEAIESDHVRFDPFLRKALRDFLFDLHPRLADLSLHNAGSSGGGGPGNNASSSNIDLNSNNNGATNSQRNLGDNTYFLAFHSLPLIHPLRAMRTDAIGRLASLSGTVTRTSDVRPELIAGTFRCTTCGLAAERIPQQYHFTRPVLCRNPRCGNRSDFLLDVSSSDFCDWQKMRIQENSKDVPPGSMPRSMDIVVRNEMVERAKAGDRVVFSGSLVVVPDGSALARAGDAPRATTSRGGNAGRSSAGDAATGGGGGLKGLKALGVRELTYRTCFVACTVIPVLDDVDAHGRDTSDTATDLTTTHSSSGKRMHHKHDAASVMARFMYGPNAGNNHNSDPDAKTSREVAMEMTNEEREEIRAMKDSPNLYAKMVKSIAPSIFGHMEVKRGILLQLLGGVHKTTAEGIRLRGDVNVCIVGDPSTAKSQFLKYIHSFLPSRSVYTSGKASSAAGLTASVQRDQDTGEFCIEAGALMLADNGICCIDEFDKMDPKDQVAIHEAMEQQTISITKAGIQATLNARASILAAANPIYGRYDRSKTLRANVALSAPILSRFDLFFVVLDERDELSDYNVAKHILDVHRCVDGALNPPFSTDAMRRYLRFAKTLKPKITHESQKLLVDCYRKLRQGDAMGRSRTAYRITVRQLESMIRLSEALARLHCDDEVRPTYVREAFRLLRKSIIHVETEDISFDDDEDGNDNDNNGNTASHDKHKNSHDKIDHDQSDAVGTPPSSSNNSKSTKRLHTGEYIDPKQQIDATSSSTSTNEDDITKAKTTELNKTNPPSGPDSPRKKKAKRSSKKVQITFEQYEAISNAIAAYLRSKEIDDSSSANESSDKTSTNNKGDNNDTKSKYLTKGELIQWYLEQCEEQIGNSMEEYHRLRKLTNLVIKKLISVDHVLVYVGDNDESDEDDRKIAVHPNYVI